MELNKCKKAELSCCKWQASSTFNFLKAHSKSSMALWIHFFFHFSTLNYFYLLIREKSSTAELQSATLCLKTMTGEENFTQSVSVLLNSYSCLRFFWKSQLESFSTNHTQEKKYGFVFFFFFLRYPIRLYWLRSKVVHCLLDIYFPSESLISSVLLHNFLLFLIPNCIV